MSLIDEALANNSGAAFKGALDQAIDNISGSQSITFQSYTRTVLPIDGFVFWVKTANAQPMEISGSLHTVSTKQQDPEQSYGRNQVIFTSKQDAQQLFNELDNGTILIGTYGPLKFAFSRLGYYANAGEFHYSGVAIMPHMMSQIIDDATDFDSQSVVVSNSLPLFLSLNNYTPFYGFGNSIPIFPSHITTPNFVPPYASVEITNTEAWSNAPFLSNLSSHYQLVRDRVTIVLNGVRHSDAMNFIDCLYQYSRDYNTMGFYTPPVPRDDKLAQNELFMIAMRKRIDFEISYQQSVVRDVARQLIEKCVPNVQGVWPSRWGDLFPPET